MPVPEKKDVVTHEEAMASITTLLKFLKQRKHFKLAEFNFQNELMKFRRANTWPEKKVYINSK